MKLNVGCGPNLLDGYVNIDTDNIGLMRKRYPGTIFSEDAHIYTYDIFNLPYNEESVDEIIANSLLEHLSFEEEPAFLREMLRLLKPNGIFTFSVPNFEKIVKRWLEAKDDWKDFYRTDDEAISATHWFGTYSYDQDNRWGYLTAMLYGNQNGKGQFHKNCYTIAKIKLMMSKVGCVDVTITEFIRKGNRDPMIGVLYRKQ